MVVNLIGYSVVFGEGLARWWWQNCRSPHFPQRWNGVVIGSPALGVLTLGIRIHNRMWRKRKKIIQILLWEASVSDCRETEKHHWHPLNNPLTSLFSLKKAVSEPLWHVCSNIYTVFVPWGFLPAHIYFCAGGCYFYYSFPDENMHNEYGLWEFLCMVSSQGNGVWRETPDPEARTPTQHSYADFDERKSFI